MIMTRSPLRGQPKGFTIVEVMIAIALLAALTGMVWSSISALYRTRDIVEERSARMQAVRITMDRLSKEVASAFVAGPEFGGEELPGEEDSEASLNPSAEMPKVFGMFGEEDNIHFTGFGHQRTVEGERAGYGAEIGYFIREERDEDGESVRYLMRRVDTSFDERLERGGIIQKVLKDVEEIEFEYWDPGATQLGSLEEIAAEGKWVDRWDTTRREFAGRLPTRVRITLTLAPLGPMKNSQVFMTQVQTGMSEVLEY